MRAWPVGLVLWLILLACVEVAGFLALWDFFVRTEHGQWLDTVALTGNSIGRSRIDDLIGTILDGISAVSLAVATAAIGFIALARRRIALAVGAVLLIVGANVTTQLLKLVITRPDLGIDPERAAAGNSLPSGHTTIAASVAVALLLVLPARVRGFGAILGAVFVAAAGVATLSAGWHRPSDAVAALLVVGGWACAAGVFIVAAQRRHGGVEYDPPSRMVVLALVLAAVVLLVGGAAAMEVTEQSRAATPDDLGRLRLFVAYAGGAAGIAGTASLLLASVLATAHRVVPRAVAAPVEADRGVAAVAR
jgi:membrane-associated phospholipid phosphatase